MALHDRMELDSMEDVFLQDNLGPTIAEHALRCSRLFKEYMTASEIVPDPTLLDDQLARFTLWASNMDVFGPLNVSLDYRLRYSPTAVDIVHQLLDVICTSLTSLQPTHDSPQTLTAKKRRISEAGNAEVTAKFADDSSDSDSDEDQAQKTALLITYTIGGTVTRLFRLSNAIRKSASASRARKIEGYRDNQEANIAVIELRLYTECYIRFRFPQAPEALRSALVEANALRLRRLYYQMLHRRRIALSVQHPQADPKGLQLPTIPARIPVLRFASNVLPKPKAIHEKLKPTSLPTSLPPAPVTYATTARQTAVGALYADSAVEVPRAKSVLVNSKFSFPSAPATNECPYCGVILEFRGTTMWNDHVMRDLEPFVCIFAHCTDSTQQEQGSLTFETSKAWMSHMQNAHGYSWECRAPSHDPIIFEQEVEFQEHSHKEHGVPEAHVGTLSGAARRPTFEKVRECPFGDEFSAPENAESNTIFTNEALYLHVAAHMKEIALLALQKLPSEDDEKSEDVASDAPLEDSGVAKLRGSMHSVLDDESLDFFSDETEDGVSNIIEKDISFSADRLHLEEAIASDQETNLVEGDGTSSIGLGGDDVDDLDVAAAYEPHSPQFAHHDYTVGWICALAKELTVATAMLDQVHPALPKPPHDQNTYKLGSIGKHNVVIACQPKGRHPTISAAKVATNMMDTFPSIRVGLIVGIGGGVPPRVRLGDVVVSTPVAEYPGVIQWDMGKAEEGGQFKRTGSLNNPPIALLTALTNLATEHETNGTKISQYLDNVGKRYPRLMSRYLWSGLLQDPLAKADGSDTTRGDICVHYGLIASGNKVIKDAKIRDRLNESLGGTVLCVEMEAAGLMNDFPCLVIRGICDYADSDKNKEWQEYAAAVAAGYTKEFLEIIDPTSIAHTPEAHKVMQKRYEATDMMQGLDAAHERAADSKQAGQVSTDTSDGDWHQQSDRPFVKVGDIEQATFRPRFDRASRTLSWGPAERAADGKQAGQVSTGTSDDDWHRQSDRPFVKTGDAKKGGFRPLLDKARRALGWKGAERAADGKQAGQMSTGTSDGDWYRQSDRPFVKAGDIEQATFRPRFDRASRTLTWGAAEHREVTLGIGPTPLTPRPRDDPATATAFPFPPPIETETASEKITSSAYISNMPAGSPNPVTSISPPEGRSDSRHSHPKSGEEETEPKRLYKSASGINTGDQEILGTRQT